MDFIYSWPGMGLMAVLLIGLVGVLIYVRKKQSDD
ncbi:LPXTG cell wall anchor domain-containing protein [Zavarzinella formosa]|nr:LPXTG cell wall anchor domain-containing protein [Zavarzinella formosa]